MRLTIIQGHSPVAYAYAPDEKALVVEATPEALPEAGYLLLEMQAEQLSPVLVKWELYISEEEKEDEEPALRAEQTVMARHRLYAGFALEALLGVRTPPLAGQYALYVSGALKSLADVKRVRVRFEAHEDFERVILYRMIATRQPPDFTVLSDKPMLDMLGQSTALHWPFKARTHAELTKRLEQERARALTFGEEGAPYAEDRSIFGGDIRARLTEGSGTFETIYHMDRWYFVDPDGCAYLACGAGGEGCEGVFMHVDGMGGLCQELPDPNDALFTEAYMLCGEVDEYRNTFQGESAAPQNMMVNFTRVSLMHAFKDAWRSAFADIHSLCLHEAGVNLMDIACLKLPGANIMDYVARARVPYTLTLLDFPSTGVMIGGKFPDVFSEEYEQACDEYVAALEPFAEDEWLFGIMFAPVPEWLYEEHGDLGRRALDEQEPTKTREKLIAFLREHYDDSVALLNAAWQTEFESFDDARAPEGELSESARGALKAFGELMLERCARAPLEALRRADKAHLALGFRFDRPCEALSALAKPFDALVMRCADDEPTQTLNEARAMSDRPILLTGFQFGTLDRDLPGGGQNPRENQEERALAIRRYMEQGFAHPACAGMICESFFDLPPFGRYDGQTGQIGLCDIAMLPYADAMREFALASSRAHGVAAGRLKPLTI